MCITNIARNVENELGFSFEFRDQGNKMRALRIPVARRSGILALCFAVLVEAAISSPLHSGGIPVSAGITRPAPRAVIPFNTFDFGDVYNGEVISQIFVIRNDGDADLLIKDFKGDCGCTVTRSDKIIPPGKEGTANLEVQTVSQSGLIVKTATLHSNDPDQPAIIFSLVANVLAGAPLRQGRYIGPIFLSPGAQGSMFAVAGKRAATEFLVTADKAPVKLIRVEGGGKTFTSRLEVIEPGRSYKILVESLQIKKGDLYTDQLRVLTDNPTLPSFPIDLALRVYDNQ